MTDTQTAEICRYHGPATPDVPTGTWVAVRVGWYNRARAWALFTLPDATPRHGVSVRSDDLTSYIHDVPIRAELDGWTLANPADAPLLAASADAALSHVRRVAHAVSPIIHGTDRAPGVPDPI